jgi:cobalt/nickel transport system permease protein
MPEIFSDIFTYRENALARTDPRTRLIVSLCAIVLVVCSKGTWYPLAVFLFSMALISLLRVPVRLVAARLLIPMGIVLVIVLLKLFMTVGDPLFQVSFGQMTLTASREGFRGGLILGARVAGAVSMIILLGVTTPAHEVFRALFWMKAPREWVEVAMLMYRYIFVLIETAANMATAQRLRLGYSGARESLRSLGVLSGSVVLRSAEQAVKTSEAMMLRGYQGSLPVSAMSPFTRADLVATVSLCAFFAALFGVLEWPFR